MSNTIIEYKYRDMHFMASVDATAPEFLEYAKKRLEREAKYAVDEKPKRDKRIAETKRLRKLLDEAKQKAVEHMRLVLPYDVLQIIDEMKWEDLILTKGDLTVLNWLVPQLHVSSIHDFRSQLDPSILNEYWEAQKIFGDFIGMSTKSDPLQSK